MLIERLVLLSVGRGRKEKWEMESGEVLGTVSELIVYVLVAAAAVW